MRRREGGQGGEEGRREGGEEGRREGGQGGEEGRREGGEEGRREEGMAVSEPGPRPGERRGTYLSMGGEYRTEGADLVGGPQT